MVESSPEAIQSLLSMDSSCKSCMSNNSHDQDNDDAVIQPRHKILTSDSFELVIFTVASSTENDNDDCSLHSVKNNIQCSVTSSSSFLHHSYQQEIQQGQKEKSDAYSISFTCSTRIESEQDYEAVEVSLNRLHLVNVTDDVVQKIGDDESKEEENGSCFSADDDDDDFELELELGKFVNDQGSEMVPSIAGTTNSTACDDEHNELKISLSSSSSSSSTTFTNPTTPTKTKSKYVSSQTMTTLCDLRPMNALFDDDILTMTPRTISVAGSSTGSCGDGTTDSTVKIANKNSSNNSSRNNRIGCERKKRIRSNSTSSSSTTSSTTTTATNRSVGSISSYTPSTKTSTPKRIFLFYENNDTSNVEGTIARSIGTDIDVIDKENCNNKNTNYKDNEMNSGENGIDDDVLCCQPWQFWSVCPREYDDKVKSAAQTSNLSVDNDDCSNNIMMRYYDPTIGCCDYDPSTLVSASSSPYIYNFDATNTSRGIREDDNDDDYDGPNKQSNDTMTTPLSSSSSSWQANVQRSLRSRAFDMTMRKQRLDSLKRELYPFDDKPLSSNHTNLSTIMKSRSFNITNRSFPARTSTPKPFCERVTAPTKTVINKHTLNVKDNNNNNNSPDFQSVLGCGAMGCITDMDFDTYQTNFGSSPAAIRLSHKRECMSSGYDSDPEDSIRNDNTLLWSSATTKANKTTDIVQSKNSPVRNDCSDRNDECYLSSVVQNFMNQRSTLLVHFDKNDGDKNGRDVVPSITGNTIAVHAWVERGQRLREKILLPKFVWMPIVVRQQLGHSNHDQDNRLCNTNVDTITSKQNYKIQHERDTTQSIELLDICRVVPVIKPLDRTRYPFVRSAHAFFIRTIANEEYIFEASSEHERDRIVHSLKHVVARFASKILLQDETAVVEFFSHRMSGPGDVPGWLNKKHQQQQQSSVPTSTIKMATTSNTVIAPSGKTSYESEVMSSA